MHSDPFSRKKTIVTNFDNFVNFDYQDNEFNLTSQMKSLPIQDN